MKLLIDKYAGILNEEMAKELFTMLEKKYGTIKVAAEKCDLTRKSIYDWNSLSDEIKFKTKKKVLSVALQEFPLETLEKLLTRTKASSIDILQAFLSTLYQKAMKTKDKDEFLKWANTFEDYIKRYNGILHNELEYEVIEMQRELYLRSNDFKIKLFTTPPHLFDTKFLIENVPGLVESLFRYPEIDETPEELAQKYKIPIEVIQSIKEKISNKISEIEENVNFAVSGEERIELDYKALTEPVTIRIPDTGGVIRYGRSYGALIDNLHLAKSRSIGAAANSIRLTASRLAANSAVGIGVASQRQIEKFYRELLTDTLVKESDADVY